MPDVSIKGAIRMGLKFKLGRKAFFNAKGKEQCVVIRNYHLKFFYIRQEFRLSLFVWYILTSTSRLFHTFGLNTLLGFLLNRQGTIEFVEIFGDCFHY